MSSQNAAGRKAIRIIMIFTFTGIITAVSYYYISMNDPDATTRGIDPANPDPEHNANSGAEVVLQPEQSEVITKVIPVQPFKKITADHAIPKASVKPPIPDFVAEPVVKFIRPEEGGYLKNLNGSVVQIPANAFVDANGKAVKENVKVSFREFRDYKDIFFSGIPMVYKVNDTENQFESAGMMELEANAGGKDVYVNPQSQIKVMLSSNTNKSDYNLYYFDKQKGNWVEKGKDQVVNKKRSQDQSKRERIRIAPFQPVKKEVVVTSFEGEPEDRVFLWWRSPGLDFDFSFINVTKSYAEIKALSGMKWTYRGTDAKEVYSRLFNVPARDRQQVGRRGVWHTFNIEMNKNGNTAAMTFIDDEDTLVVIVTPTDKSEKNLLRMSGRMQRYTKSYSDRMNEVLVSYAQYQIDSMTLSLDENQFAAVQYDVMRSFQVDNFGIWNVDRIIKDDQFITYNLQFVDENNKPVIIRTVYLADKNYNSVFTFFPGTAKGIRINPYSNNLLWAVLPGNRLAIASPQKIWGLQGKNGNQKVVMKISEDAIASMEKLRTELNF